MYSINTVVLGCGTCAGHLGLVAPLLAGVACLWVPSVWARVRRTVRRAGPWLDNVFGVRPGCGWLNLWLAIYCVASVTLTAIILWQVCRS